MYQTQNDLTLDEVLTDPLIRAVMRADGVQMADFKTLLHTAAGAIRQAKARQASPRPPEFSQPDFRSYDKRQPADGLFAGRLLSIIKPVNGGVDPACVGCY